MRSVLIAAAAMLAALPGLAGSGVSSESIDQETPTDVIRLPTSEIVGPDFKDPDWRDEVLTHVREVLDGRSEAELGITDSESRHLIMVSLSRENRTAVVARGEGAGIDAAIGDAASILRSHLTPSEIRRAKLKIDLAVGADPIERFDGDGRADIDRSLDGIWLLDTDLVLLPEELLSRRLVDSNGDLQSKRLRRYLAEGARAPALTVEGNPGKAGSAYRRIRFTSLVEGASGEAVPLFRGNPRNPGTSPPKLLDAADQGGRYLLRHQRKDGSFDYSYEPKKDTVSDDYNLLRHAGSCYALVELYQATGNDEYRAAADRGLEYLLTFSRPPKETRLEPAFEAIVSPGGEAKLGGAALAVLSMVQYQRATGDDGRLDRSRSMADFLLFQQEADGHFQSKYFYGPPDSKPFESIYYPGEAILALVRLYGVDPQEEWLDAARAGADWLIDVRDAGKPTSALPHDHWLLMGLDELHQLTGNDGYAIHAARIAEAIVAAQRTISPYPDWVGSFYDPPRSTPTATRAEGLVAAARLARRTGQNETLLIEALQRMAVFQLRCQITPENSLYLPRPDLARGGFRRSLTDWEVRIDYVQHNVSALLGFRSLLLSNAKGVATAD